MVDTDLIKRVEDDSVSEAPLDQLAVALNRAARLSSDADSLVDHFVARCRDQGHSWTEIGTRLGVSKQAARERFREFVEPGRESFTPRLQRCIGHAGRLAQQAGSSSIGTGHLLWALATSEGVAANVLVRLLAVDRLEAAVKASMPSDADSEVNGDPVESDEVRETLRAAHRFAQQRGHNFVGTEHVLFVLAGDPGSVAQRILTGLGVSFADIKRELASNLTIQGKAKSLGKRRTACLCSFCGKSDGSLVAGPGVWICADCTRIAAEVLANR